MAAENETPLAVRTALHVMRDREISAGFHRLLDRLRAYTEAYPLQQPDLLPDHEIVFVDRLDKPIRQAFELELDTMLALLPQDYAIVKRDQLTKILNAATSNPAFAEAATETLLRDGAAMLLNEIDLRRQNET